MYNWLSNLAPAFAAQKSWQDGSYHEEGVIWLMSAGNFPFSVVCGAHILSVHVRKFRFSDDIIRQLGQITDDKGRSQLEESFLNFLQRMKLRVQVSSPQEGTLLLPGQPLLIARGPKAQLLLLSSAFEEIILKPSYFASFAAVANWEKKHFKETNTPKPPEYEANPDGWKIRGAYVGGAAIKDLPNLATLPMPEMPNSNILASWESAENAQKITFSQTRRHLRGTQPLADIQLTEAQETTASVSKRSVNFLPNGGGEPQNLIFTRFQNLYQPVVAKGHPIVVGSKLAYFRQRTLHQLEAFSKANLGEYPLGKYQG